ncbi:MAG: glycine--tRNA ligase [Candidatus Thermoplasmatota archaeon]|nr:glycine--tRNA ligase [Candidatus Thermoplasmatota archaeon]
MDDPQELLSLCKRRGFLWPAYDIYGGAAGFFDYGPLGAAMKVNIESHWRRLHVLEEGLQELVCPVIAPESVFEASGHLDTFADLYVECTGCGETYRADHLAEGLHDNPAALKEKELGDLLRENDVSCPACKGELTAPKRFNLMFRTSVGAGSAKAGYLRPETAQGMFVNFSQIYRFGRERLPVGAVQIGRAFRNEISPRQGLLRLREFNQMEAEVFFHPERKTWPRYGNVKAEVLSLVPSNGPPTDMSLLDAVSSGTIANEALAYFMWLTQRFAVDVGVDPDRMRFRQHEKDEMAHYATDCWDLEAETGYGWVELVGVADRGCYDVQAHLKHSGADLTAFERFDEPKEVTKEIVRPKYDVMGKLFRGDTKAIAGIVAQLPPDAVRDRDSVQVDMDGRKVEVPSTCYELAVTTEKISGDKFVPHVIEPSYGVDRMLYTLLEHAYRVRDDYVTLSLKGLVAPVKVGVFPLMARDGLDDIARRLYDSLVAEGMAAYYDDSGSIGRRYARMDEVGTPCCVTVDYETKEDGQVTIRDRDSADQVRVKLDDVICAVRNMIEGRSPQSLASM